MFTIGAGAGQRGNPNRLGKENRKFEPVDSEEVAEQFQGDAGSCGKPRAAMAAPTSCWMCT